MPEDCEHSCCHITTGVIISQSAHNVRKQQSDHHSPYLSQVMLTNATDMTQSVKDPGPLLATFSKAARV